MHIWPLEKDLMFLCLFVLLLFYYYYFGVDGDLLLFFLQWIKLFKLSFW